LIFPGQGIYNITHVVTSTNNCQSSITKSVNITPRPVAKFVYSISNLVSLTSNIAFIDSSIAAVSWAWNFGNGETSTIQNPSTTYTANGTYTVSLTITDQFGCISSFTNIVRINNVASEITKLIPNMISPNNDGKNDIWRLDFINVFYPNAEISIFNRWGEELYKSTGYSNAWDGSYKGNPLPVGAYFYVIKLKDNEDRIFKGTVTLLK
jgi:gliding motility-associated-like protein